MSSWLVDLRCPNCGASGKFVDAQLIAICQYCGHVIGTHRAVIAGSESYAFAEVRSYVVPTLADVRRLELADRKYAALAARDRETLYAATLELAALDGIEAGMSPENVAAWARWTTAIEDVATFSGRVAMFAPSYHALAADPARYTADMLERYTRVYRELIADELFPVELARLIPADLAATDAILGSLASWFMYVPRSAFEIALGVLGQRPIRIHGAPLPCRTCGAAICAEALATLACTYCRSALEVRRHLWLDGILRAAAMANADTLVQRDRAYAVATLFAQTSEVPGNAPVPDHLVAAYLEGSEGITRAALDEITAFMLAHHGLGPISVATLHAIRAQLDRVPETIPPPPGRRVGSGDRSFIALEPSEAWRRAQLRNWRRLLTYASVPAEHRGLTAVNQLLPPLAGGYLPDAGDAAEFLRAVGYPHAELRAAIALHRMGEHDPHKAAFWDATAAALT